MDFIKPMIELFSICVGCCCAPSSKISVQGKSYRIVKLLGEGGFSFVYLVQDSSGNQYAMKKIRCTLGTEEADLAQREVDIYQLFSHKNIIQLIDSTTITESDGTKTIYIFLPYFKKGNLQDAINKNNMNKTHFSETDLLRQFRDVCSAVEYMHTFKSKGGARHYYGANPMVLDDGHHQALLGGQQEQVEGQNDAAKGEKGEIVPWAHRDIKPGNILIADDGETSILMDFGSAEPARLQIKSRQEALAQQDLAAEKCTMPYRAPELFDVKTNTVLDEKVDIWSLGCTLYAMAYGHSPFEIDPSGSVALAVLNNQYKFPSQSEDHYSENVRKLIQFMLVTDPLKRPDINNVITKVNDALKLS